MQDRERDYSVGKFPTELKSQQLILRQIIRLFVSLAVLFNGKFTISVHLSGLKLTDYSPTEMYHSSSLW